MQYRYFWGVPEDMIMEGILQLHEQIFSNADHLLLRMPKVPHVLVVIAEEEGQVIAYKIGYSLSTERYYSWYGAVNEDYRGRGIASALLKLQHKLVLEAGYTIVETKTRNMWRNMLITNIKHGFDIVETFMDDEGIHRIILEKKLVKLE